MLKRFLPRQDGFFELFQKSADTLVLTAAQFHHMLLDLDNQQKYVDAIAAYEEEADGVAHTTFTLLHKTFITPFDRHDIYHLTSKLDDTLDLINRCAQRFPFYYLKQVPAEMVELANNAVQCAELLKSAVAHLKSLKNAEEIFVYCDNLSAIESHAHQVVLAGEKDLYQNETDFKQFAKLKEIYSRIKSVINSCQDVANIIKGIVLEYS
jgi:uncharacterized protein